VLMFANVDAGIAVGSVVTALLFAHPRSDECANSLLL